jgi:hypothetical protein
MAVFLFQDAPYILKELLAIFFLECPLPLFGAENDLI